MLTSALFANDPLLEQIAMDVNGQRISTSQNRHDPAVGKIQKALLLWDPACLPNHGVDGDYGQETAAAVKRFKREYIHAEEPIYDDVGPQTVLHLDRIAFAHEQQAALAARIAELDQWLTPGLSGVFSSVSSSDIKVHTSGVEAFASLKAAIDTCADSRATIVIAGWGFSQDTLLVSGITVGAALREAADRGVQVRAIFNHSPSIEIPVHGPWRPSGVAVNDGPVAFVNGLPGGAAIHDARTLHHTAHSLGITLPPFPDFLVQLGAHHQKIWVVWNGNKLTAWCGGIDIDPNRTELTNSPVKPLHDVQVELNGGAAADIYQILLSRWEEHPNRPADMSLPSLSPNSVTGTHRSRVLATYGDPTKFAGLNGSPYSFAPNGSKAIRQMLSHLIRKSYHIIYVEDQYFVDESIGQELAAHMPNLKALIVLICDSNMVNNELHQAYARRKAVFNHLAPFADKVAIVTRYDRWIHAKTWIFDDTIAFVTSANCNHRGYEHDSEIGVAFGNTLNTETVREVRERLWSLHLGSDSPTPGSDPVASLPLWKSPPPGSAISVYDWNAGVDSNPVHGYLPHMSKDGFWEIIDPRCP